MRITSLLCLLLALISVSSSSEDDGDVLVLTDDNFADALNENRNIMVEFYAPWCGHCKSLAPAYAQVATALKGEVPVAKVDCTTNKETCNANGVQGFPTLKLFQNGKPTDYQNERSADAITSWIRKQTGPAALEVTPKNVDLFPTLDDVVILAGVSSMTSDNAKLFLDVAEQLRTEYQFGITTDESVKRKYAIYDEGLVLIAAFNEGLNVMYTGEWNAEDISAWVKAESFPVIGEIGPENYQRYVERALPIMWVFLAANELPVSITELTPTAAAVKEGALGFKGLVSAVYLDGEKYVRHRNQLGHHDSLPGAILEDQLNHKKYKFEGEITAESVSSFLQGFKDGTLEPFLKSETIPTEEEQATSSVKVIVGKTFNDIVMDSSKDVLVEFYAPWCGHCKNLAPTYETLANQFSAVSDLVIAKVDATANDVPVVIEGFPTLILYTKENKSTGVKYSGDRTLDDLKSFLEKNLPSIASTTSGEEEVKDEL